MFLTSFRNSIKRQSDGNIHQIDIQTWRAYETQFPNSQMSHFQQLTSFHGLFQVNIQAKIKSHPMNTVSGYLRLDSN
jgi:hypothetical protein